VDVPEHRGTVVRRLGPRRPVLALARDRRALPALLAAPLRAELAHAAARDPWRARLPRPVRPGPAGVHRGADDGGAEPPARVPRRRALDPEAAGRRPLAARVLRVARPLVQARRQGWRRSAGAGRQQRGSIAAQARSSAVLARGRAHGSIRGPMANAPLRLTLPDGSVREYPAGTTGMQVAESIGKGLAKAAVGIDLDGEVQSLQLPVARSARIRILTRDTKEGLEVLRHSAAHVM